MINDEGQNVESIDGLFRDMYFSIIATEGGWRLNGVLNINSSGGHKSFPKFNNDVVYKTVDEAHLAANKYYAEELITFIPEFNVSDVKPLNWDCPIYTQLDISLIVEPIEDNFKVAGQLTGYVNNEIVIIGTIDSTNQGEALYTSIDQALIEVKKFMRQLIITNLMHPI